MPGNDDVGVGALKFRGDFRSLGAKHESVDDIDAAMNDQKR